jgi:hypothetical protein
MLWYAVLCGEIRADWVYIGIGNDLLIVPRWHVHGVDGSFGLHQLYRRYVLGC